MGSHLGSFVFLSHSSVTSLVGHYETRYKDSNNNALRRKTQHGERRYAK